MHKWYVLHVFSTQEKKIKKTIEEQRDSKGMGDLIEEVMIPIEKLSEIKKGEQKITEKNMWPGYILVKMVLTEDAWAFIKGVYGVIGFLGGEKPAPLTDGEVQEILKDLKEKKEKVVQRHQFEVGSHVKIIDGVFVNFVGTVVDVQHDKGKLSVLVSIFGRDTRVDDLDFFQVEESSEESSNQ